jgi:hypothetical protein
LEKGKDYEKRKLESALKKQQDVDPELTFKPFVS